ncbi:MAG: hypothetical protein KKC75_05025 [Nanoarchaeota archaeon]|nr:hypothetical protein [Nanoarchaeota archaeon]MBU1004516.1 hypothetical protein [Nanoarchaeota archaeon]MBU1946064.1 hypothetical protein [Nanoarchaeota archaeon]
MQEIIFEKRISKGSRFNQIYIPKEMEKSLGVGDLVEVRLLQKSFQIYYKNQQKLSEFKEYLITGIFSALIPFTEIKSVFIVGSFLDEIAYNDIDLVIISEKEDLEKGIETLLAEKFSQKFHIIALSEEKLNSLMEKDPLTCSMLTSYASNRKAGLNYKRTIDKAHIEFLLMMPEDLLELNLPSKSFYDGIRRLITIENFLKNEKIDRKIINNQVEKAITNKLFDKIKSKGIITQEETVHLRKIIKEKLTEIKRLLDGQKR